ncbi:DUF488 family protein [Peribacillus sp. B-H-3]|uniref:DUF488 domain-containing protein n=1 Tax=Peribacillus sp. B-H-3 TaxID=3400420 RepID=UPI003B01CACE
MSKVCTIGFSKKNLRQFVNLLKVNDVQRLVDTRLNNTSQLAGYSKKDDLEYVMELHNIDYIHEPSLAPTQDILKDYKKKQISWEKYEKEYIKLLKKRKIEERIDEIFGNKTICLLCSEHEPHHCHRRLLAEYLKEHRRDISIAHLI